MEIRPGLFPNWSRLGGIVHAQSADSLDCQHSNYLDASGVQHKGDLGRANEELKLYRDEDETSDTAYRKWVAVHREMNRNLTEIVEQGSLLAKKALVEPGKIKYLWADAIANALYAYHREG
jgi:hypothetical protein